MEPLLIPDPLVRAIDRFGTGNPLINFDLLKTNLDDPIIKGKPNFDSRWQAEFYKKIGIDIVTETVFDYPYPFTSEKTFRPIASMRPFIMVGPYHTLDFVKDLGFKTFSAIIDESYDDIHNSEERFITVCSCIKNFVSRPLKEIQKDIDQVSDILIYNRQHLLTLFASELERFKDQI